MYGVTPGTHELVGIKQKIGRTNLERRSQNLEARSKKAILILHSAFCILKKSAISSSGFAEG
jgi:hypothetical protein